MNPVPSGVQVWLATGHTDMRKGFDGLALQVQETLKRNPNNGQSAERGAVLEQLELRLSDDGKSIVVVQAVARDTGVLVSHDGGQTWSRLAYPRPFSQSPQLAADTDLDAMVMIMGHHA